VAGESNGARFPSWINVLPTAGFAPYWTAWLAGVCASTLASQSGSTNIAEIDSADTLQRPAHYFETVFQP
jgi:hypothetical protein